MMKKMNRMPARAWHVPAAVLAVLLTAALWMTQLGLFGVQVLTSRSLHERVALDPSAVDLQMRRISEEVQILGDEYGFSPEPVTAAITRAQVEEMDRQTVAWWTGLARTGELEDVPSIQTDLAEVLSADEGFVGGLNPLAVNSTIESIQNRVDEAVRKTGVLFRDALLKAGLRQAEGRVNLPELMQLFRMLPAAGGAASLLLAGLIALMMSRKIQTAGQYIGGALSACGLLMLLTLGLLKMLNLRGMIGEASRALQAQYIHLARIISLETAAAAIVLMLLGGGAMIWAVRTRRKAA